MTPFIPLADGFAVAPQLTAQDFARAAAAGYRMVINNRPDGEAHDQLSNTAAEAAAKAAGLEYRHIPVGMPPPDAAAAQVAEAIADGPGPILAYCRSGTRSASLWALAQARSGMTAKDILASAAAAGYDLSSLRDRLGKGG